MNSFGIFVDMDHSKFQRVEAQLMAHKHAPVF